MCMEMQDSLQCWLAKQCWKHALSLCGSQEKICFWGIPHYKASKLADNESDQAAEEQNILFINKDMSKLHDLKQSSILNQLLLQ